MRIADHFQETCFWERSHPAAQNRSRIRWYQNGKSLELITEAVYYVNGHSGRSWLSPFEKSTERKRKDLQILPLIREKARGEVCNSNPPQCNFNREYW